MKPLFDINETERAPERDGYASNQAIDRILSLCKPCKSNNEMRELGFTDHLPEKWYLCRGIDKYCSFNLAIDKASGEYDTLIMDEAFGQPYYYNSMNNSRRDFIIDKVDGIINKLNNNGLNIVHDHNEYGTRRSE